MKRIILAALRSVGVKGCLAAILGLTAAAILAAPGLGGRFLRSH